MSILRLIEEDTSQEQRYAPTDDEVALARRVRLQVPSLLTRFRTTQVSVGDGIQVVYGAEEIKSYGINRLGRLRLEEKKQVFYAGPKLVKTDPQYISSIISLQRAVDEFVEGKDPNWDLMQPYPELKEAKTRDYYAINPYEKALLAEFRARNMRITVVNPSKGTLWRAMEVGLRCWVLLEGEGMKSLEEIEDLLMRKEFLRSGIKIAEYVEGVPYLGTNGKTREGPFISLLANPFAVPFVFKYYAFKEVDKNIEISYERKERIVRTKLEFEPDYDLYSPTMVDNYFKVQGMMFWLLSRDFDMPAIASGGVVAASIPREIPPYEQGVSIADGVLYDIQGSGTFLSRRHKVREEARMRGLDVVQLGAPHEFPVMIDWMGLRPKSSDYRLKENVMSTFYAEISSRPLVQSNPIVVYDFDSDDGEVDDRICKGSLFVGQVSSEGTRASVYYPFEEGHRYYVLRGKEELVRYHSILMYLVTREEPLMPVSYFFTAVTTEPRNGKVLSQQILDFMDDTYWRESDSTSKDPMEDDSTNMYTAKYIARALGRTEEVVLKELSRNLAVFRFQSGEERKWVLANKCIVRVAGKTLTSIWDLWLQYSEIVMEATILEVRWIQAFFAEQGRAVRSVDRVDEKYVLSGLITDVWYERNIHLGYDPEEKRKAVIFPRPPKEEVPYHDLLDWEET